MGKIIRCDFRRTQRQARFAEIGAIAQQQILGINILPRDKMQELDKEFEELLLEEKKWGNEKWFK